MPGPSHVPHKLLHRLKQLGGNPLNLRVLRGPHHTIILTPIIKTNKLTKLRSRTVISFKSLHAIDVLHINEEVVKQHSQNLTYSSIQLKTLPNNMIQSNQNHPTKLRRPSRPTSQKPIQQPLQMIHLIENPLIQSHIPQRSHRFTHVMSPPPEIVPSAKSIISTAAANTTTTGTGGGALSIKQHQLKPLVEIHSIGPHKSGVIPGAGVSLVYKIKHIEEP